MLEKIIKNLIYIIVLAIAAVFLALGAANLVNDHDDVVNTQIVK